jgi:hypothetical protein
LQEDYYEQQLDPVDQPDARDPQSVAEYAVEIYDLLLKTESENTPKVGYMDK